MKIRMFWAQRRAVAGAAIRGENEEMRETITGGRWEPRTSRPRALQEPGGADVCRVITHLGARLWGLEHDTKKRDLALTTNTLSRREIRHHPLIDTEPGRPKHRATEHQVRSSDPGPHLRGRLLLGDSPCG